MISLPDTSGGINLGRQSIHICYCAFCAVCPRGRNGRRVLRDHGRRPQENLTHASVQPLSCLGKCFLTYLNVGIFSPFIECQSGIRNNRISKFRKGGVVTCSDGIWSCQSTVQDVEQGFRLGCDKSPFGQFDISRINERFPACWIMCWEFFRSLFNIKRL